MTTTDRPNDFATHADADDPGLLQEFWEFLRFNKKWWLTPILITMFLVGMLVALSGTAAAPFLYSFW